jgi:O-antigen ligase
MPHAPPPEPVAPVARIVTAPRLRPYRHGRPMQSSVLTASQHSIANDPPALRVLCVALGALLAILPLAHVTALRNTFIAIVIVAALLQFRLAPWKSVPGVRQWLVWLVFAASSIAWSALPDASFQSFRSDQFYPFIVFLVSFVLMEALGGRLAFAIGGSAGMLFCVATMSAAVILGTDPDAAPQPGVLGWLAWKAGAAPDSNTYVAFIAVPLYRIVVTSREGWRRSAAAACVVIFAALGFLSESRTLIATLFVSLIGYLLAFGILRGALRWKSVLAIAVAGSIVSAACIEVISRARLPEPRPLDRSVAIEMIESDSRPAIWGTYSDLVRKRPWFGVGLGRGVPSRAYHLEDDATLRRIDAQAWAHGHNLLLDLVLEVGVVGLAVWLWLHFEILRLTWQRAKVRGDNEKAWAAAAVALMVALLVKNSTNDLAVYGNAILFWALMGAMLGLTWRRAEVAVEAELPRGGVPG